jgi:hypothetical protein
MRIWPDIGRKTMFSHKISNQFDCGTILIKFPKNLCYFDNNQLFKIYLTFIFGQINANIAKWESN